MTPTTLALDIGNGSVKYARFEDGRRGETGRLPLDTDFAACPPADRVAAVSVQPGALARARLAFEGLAVVGEDLPLPIEVRYEPPADCGTDRVMGVWGALQRLPDAAGVLLFDAGTCLTATVGLREGGVLGGAILPGPLLMARALHEGTAGLPLVEPESPDSPLGRSTAGSIRTGIEAAVSGAVAQLIARFRAAVDTPLTVVAAGTGAGALAAACAGIEFVHPFATLWGVYRVASAA